MSAPPHSQNHSPEHTHGHAHDAELARIIELDAVVHHGYLFEVTNWLRALASDIRVRRILDVGAGTGSGTLALAQRFPSTHIVATDISANRLERVRELAFFGGIAERVTTERADAVTDLPRLGVFDLAWASASLHEVSDSEQAFRNLHEAIRPAGILAVIEMDAAPRMLPDELVGLEERLHAALELTGNPRTDHPDWSVPLAKVGFEAMSTRTFTIDERITGRGPAGEYATLYLRRLAHAARAHLSIPDRDLMETLLGDGPDSLRRRDDLRLRGTRTAWVVRRPSP